MLHFDLLRVFSQLRYHMAQQAVAHSERSVGLFLHILCVHLFFQAALLSICLCHC